MTIDDLYQSIADNITANVTEDWNTAHITAERTGDDALSLEGGYDKGEGVFTPFKFRNFDRRIIVDFHQLHKITTEGGSNRWNRARYTLHRDGKISIDFQWDQKLADEVEDNL
ncbi:hypothetical protein [Endozoicomonas sp. 4G]|uniref:hypothetical protein n=1 Tax=Endozoicomonas sp. 4G TaxID=2872754 RepID=UPI002078AA2E|nr:hypothetical protein [Endozoicomonas sp. 4G]